MRFQVESNQLLSLSKELRSLHQIIESNETNISKSITNLINETNTRYNEYSVRSETSQIAELLKEIRTLASSITNNLHDQAIAIDNADNQYKTDEENLKKLIAQSEYKNPTQDSKMGTIEQITSTNKKFLDDDKWIQAARDSIIAWRSATLNTFELVSYLKTSNGLTFKMFNESGKTFIRIVDGKIASNLDFAAYKRLLKQSLGGQNSKWTERLVKALVNKTVPIFDNYTNTFMKNSIKFQNTALTELSNQMSKLERPPILKDVLGAENRAFIQRPQDLKYIDWKAAGNTISSTGGSTFIKELKVCENFNWKDASKLSKAGKFLGAAGTVLTVFDNFSNDLVNPNTGELDLSIGNYKKFAVDTAVDIAAGAAATATGAAVGSLFVPPVGTVVGAALGAGTYFVINVEFIGDPPQSVVDFTKNTANYLTSKEFIDDTLEVVDDAIEKIGEAADFVEEKLDSAVDYVGDKLSNLFW